MTPRQHPLTKPRNILLIVLFSLLALFSLYQGRFIISGPQVWVDNLRDGETVPNSVIIVAGRAKNTAWLTLNDRQIFTDEEGHWSEKLVVSPGLSVITVKARDRFGHEVYKNLQVVLN